MTKVQIRNFLLALERKSRVPNTDIYVDVIDTMLYRRYTLGAWKENSTLLSLEVAVEMLQDMIIEFQLNEVLNK
jgi:hypothetical protein